MRDPSPDERSLAGVHRRRLARRRTVPRTDLCPPASGGMGPPPTAARRQGRIIRYDPDDQGHIKAPRGSLVSGALQRDYLPVFLSVDFHAAIVS